MECVTTRDLRERSRSIWQRPEAGDEFAITRNGKPFALLVRTERHMPRDTRPVRQDASTADGHLHVAEVPYSQSLTATIEERWPCAVRPVHPDSQ